jgi:hypothetical protein
MKTTVELEGYQVSISCDDDRISVMAMLDEEVVEEFTIDIEEGSEGGDVEEDDLKAFGDDEGEVQDFEDEVPGEGVEDEELESQLESFTSFVKKRK